MKKSEICETYALHKQDILELIQKKVMRWHTPIRGYADAKELDEDKLYRFLKRSREAILENRIHPEDDIVEQDNGDIIFVQNAWFYQYWILKEKYRNGDIV